MKFKQINTISKYEKKNKILKKLIFLNEKKGKKMKAKLKNLEINVEIS